MILINMVFIVLDFVLVKMVISMCFLMLKGLGLSENFFGIKGKLMGFFGSKWDIKWLSGRVIIWMVIVEIWSGFEW